MKGWKLLKKNRKAGITLVETLVSATLMVSLVCMAAAAIAPGTRLVLKLQDLHKSQQVMDALLEDITYQISTATSNVRVNHMKDAVDFSISEGYHIGISSEGYTPPALDPSGELVPISAGKVFYRHYTRVQDKKVVTPFPDGFYAKRYIKLGFEQDASNQMITVKVDMFSDAARTQKILSGEAVAKYKTPIYATLTTVTKGEKYKVAFEPEPGVAPPVGEYEILQAAVHGIETTTDASGNEIKEEKRMRKIDVNNALKELSIVTPAGGTSLTDTELFNYWVVLRVKVPGDESDSPRFIKLNLSDAF